MSLVAPVRYAYVSAKISALLPKIVQPHLYGEFMGAEKLEDAVDLLRRTQYGSSAADLKVGEDFSLMVDKALYGEVNREMERILRYSPKKVRPFLRSIIEHEENRALKTVLKALLIGVDASSVVFKISPFGEYTVDVCLEIIRRGSIEAALGYLKDASLRRELASALAGKRGVEMGFEVDMIVERHSVLKMLYEFERLKGMDRVRMKILLGYEADVRNIVNVLRALNLGLNFDVGRLGIPFHRHMTETHLKGMAEAEDVSKALSFIPDLYRGVFDVSRVGEREFLSSMEVSVERFLASKYLGTFAGYRMHVGVVWAYLKLLIYGASDIRMILMARMYNFKPVEIENKLILLNLH